MKSRNLVWNLEVFVKSRNHIEILKSSKPRNLEIFQKSKDFEISYANLELSDPSILGPMAWHAFMLSFTGDGDVLLEGISTGFSIPRRCFQHPTGIKRRIWYTILQEWCPRFLHILNPLQWNIGICETNTGWYLDLALKGLLLQCPLVWLAGVLKGAPTEEWSAFLTVKLWPRMLQNTCKIHSHSQLAGTLQQRTHWVMHCNSHATYRRGRLDQFLSNTILERI